MNAPIDRSLAAVLSRIHAEPMPEASDLADIPLDELECQLERLGVDLDGDVDDLVRSVTQGATRGPDSQKPGDLPGPSDVAKMPIEEVERRLVNEGVDINQWLTRAQVLIRGQGLARSTDSARGRASPVTECVQDRRYRRPRRIKRGVAAGLAIACVLGVAFMAAFDHGPMSPEVAPEFQGQVYVAPHGLESRTPQLEALSREFRTELLASASPLASQEPDQPRVEPETGRAQGPSAPRELPSQLQPQPPRPEPKQRKLAKAAVAPVPPPRSEPIITARSLSKERGGARALSAMKGHRGASRRAAPEAASDVAEAREAPGASAFSLNSRAVSGLTGAPQSTAMALTAPRVIERKLDPGQRLSDVLTDVGVSAADAEVLLDLLGRKSLLAPARLRLVMRVRTVHEAVFQSGGAAPIRIQRGSGGRLTVIRR